MLETGPDHRAEPLDAFIDASEWNAHFDPHAALAAAYDALARDYRRADANLLAFRAHAELFADGPDKSHAEHALRHYEAAVALNQALRLFPERYSPSALIGVGGFSYVFKVARQRGMTPMALKVLKQKNHVSRVHWEEFRATLEKLVQCGSPYVAKIHESSTPSDPFPPYYIMDYVEGRSLRSWIDDEVAARKSGAPQSARSFLELMTIARQIAEGLAAAHAVDVLHLDLKPENVLLGKSDSGEEAVRLVDFNFVSLQRGGLPTYSFLPLQATLNYTAPEVKQNVRNASARSDIYSLGLLILEMATGGVDARAGFEGASQLAQEEPSLAILVLHCLEPEPGARPRDAQHVAGRLQASKNDLDQREVERRKFEDHAFIAAAKTSVGGDWFDIVFALVDLARKRRWGEAELAIAVAVPPVLIAALVKHQWDLFGTWRADPAFAPCFVAALSFTVLSALYFFRLVSRCDFRDAQFPNTMRFLMSVIYALPVMAGAYYPRFWPAFAAMGLLFVGVTNLGMWQYARGFVNHSPRLLRSERTAIVATLQGYTLWALIYSLALLAVNVLVGAGLLVAVVIVLVNCVLYWTKVHGDTATGIWKGLRLEDAIRARITDQ